MVGCPLWAQAWPALRGRVQSNVSTQTVPRPVAPERLWKKAVSTPHTCSPLNTEAVETRASGGKRQRTNTYTPAHSRLYLEVLETQTEMHGTMSQRQRLNQGRFWSQTPCAYIPACHSCYLTFRYAISSKAVRGKYSPRPTLPYLRLQSMKSLIPSLLLSFSRCDSNTRVVELHFPLHVAVAESQLTPFSSPDSEGESSASGPAG